MRLTIDDILAAHGIGTGPGAFFGNGSDGAFNPTGTATVSGTVTFGVGGTGYYSGAQGAVNWQSPYPTNTTGTYPSFQLITGGNGLASQTIAPTTPSFTSLNFGSDITYGIDISPSTDIQISGYGFYGAAAASNFGTALYDNSAGAVLYNSGNTLSISAGVWCNVTLPNPIILKAGKNYRFTITSYNSSAAGAVYCFGSGSGSSQSISYSNLQIPQTTTFTAASQDGAPVIKQFTSVNIPQGAVVTVDKRCQGLVMLVNGDVTINGEIIMDYLGAIADPTTTAGAIIPNRVYQLYYPYGNNKMYTIGPGGVGGAGGTGGVYTGTPGGLGGNGSNGTWWGGGRGGGGGGGQTGGSYGGNGGDGGFGTSSGGASSSGAGNAGTNSGGGSGASVGSGTPSGAGGISNGGGGAGGGGAGYGASGNAGQNSSSQGAGGLILIIASGSITIGSNATLSAKGTVGANGGWCPNTASGNTGSGGGGGGGAGGGVIALFYRNSFTNSGKTVVTGGAGGIGGTNENYQYLVGLNGKPGGSGLVQTVKLT